MSTLHGTSMMTGKGSPPRCNALEEAIDIFRHHASASGYVVEEVRLCEPSPKQPSSPRVFISESTAPPFPSTEQTKKPSFHSIKQRRIEKLSSRTACPLPPIAPLPLPHPLTHSQHGTGIKRTVSGGMILHKPLRSNGQLESSQACMEQKEGLENVDGIAATKLTKKWCEQMHMGPAEPNASQHDVDGNYSQGQSSSASLEDIGTSQASAKLSSTPGLRSECITTTNTPELGRPTNNIKMVNGSNDTVKSLDRRCTTHGENISDFYQAMKPSGSCDSDMEMLRDALREQKRSSDRTDFNPFLRIEMKKRQETSASGHRLEEMKNCESDEKTSRLESGANSIRSVKGHQQKNPCDIGNNLNRLQKKRQPQLNLRSRPMHEININTGTRPVVPQVKSVFAFDSHEGEASTTKQEIHGLFAQPELKEKDVIISAVRSGLPVKKREFHKQVVRSIESKIPQGTNKMDWVRDIPDSHVHLFLSSVACIKARESRSSSKGDENSTVAEEESKRESGNVDLSGQVIEPDGKHTPEMECMDITPDRVSPRSVEIEDSINGAQGDNKHSHEADSVPAKHSQENVNVNILSPSSTERTASPSTATPVTKTEKNDRLEALSSENTTADGDFNLPVTPLTRRRRDTTPTRRGCYSKSNANNEDKGHYGNNSNANGGTKTIRPFKCRLCSSSFDRDGHLRVHILAVHEKKRPFVCQICNSSFGHSSSLLRHVRTVHQAAAEAADGVGTQLRSGRRQVPASIIKVQRGNGSSITSGGSGTGLKSNIGKNDRKHARQDSANIEHRPFRCSVCAQTFGKVALLNRHVANKHPISSMRGANGQQASQGQSSNSSGSEADHNEMRNGNVSKTKGERRSSSNLMVLDDEDEDDDEEDDRKADEDYVLES